MSFTEPPSYPQALNGHVDVIKENLITGWAHSPGLPGQRLEVHIFIAGKLAGTASAEHFRADLQAAGLGDGWKAFYFDPRRFIRGENDSVHIAFALTGEILPNGTGTLAYSQLPANPDWDLPAVTPIPVSTRLDRYPPANWPLISLLLPAGDVSPLLLERTIASVRAQSYSRWELHLIGRPGDTAQQTVLKRIVAIDERLSLAAPPGNPAANAFTRMRSVYAGVLDPRCELVADALAEVAARLLEQPDSDAIYADHDTRTETGELLETFLKPGWSPTHLLGINYIGPLVVARTALLQAAGDGTSPNDPWWHSVLMLRLSALAARGKHVPRILCHHCGPAATYPPLSVVQDHLARLRLPVRAASHPNLSGRVQLVPHTDASQPRISIIIPSRDAAHHLDSCLRSLFKRNSYRNFEVLVADNGTTDPAALQVLASHPIRWLKDETPFSFSRINNLAVREATGEVLVFLNNDTEVLTPDWLPIMLAHLQLPGVGVVGPQLVYPDGSLQHAGMVLGFRGTADHVMRGFDADGDGYHGSLSCSREVSAVTGACLMIRRDLFLELDGMDEAYRLVYQDVDLCLRVRRTGRAVLYAANARLIHHESASRGSAYDEADRKLFIARWTGELALGDTFYHPEFTRNRSDYVRRGWVQNASNNEIGSLRSPPRETMAIPTSVPTDILLRKKTLRLLVDLNAMRPGGEGGGIKPALLEMLRWLGRQKTHGLEFIYVANPETRAEVCALARPADRVVDAADATADLAARLACDLVYCPFGVTDLACPGIPTVTLVVDLLHRDFPATLPDPDRIYREQKFAVAAAITDRFQVISDYTGRRLHHHHAIPDARVFRTLLPVHGRLPAAAASGAPFFFYPANFWLHKNHDTLLDAYARYRQAAGAEAWPLLLTGHPHPERLTALQQTAHTLGIEEGVIFKGYVSDEELANYYRSAGALVFPSLHEGFGIPLLEAMASGTPIIAHNATALPEIAGPAALLVDARRPAELAAALQRVATDLALRTSLTAAGHERLRNFSAGHEFNHLLENLLAVAAQPARWRHSGYYPIDGLTGPLAIFALPATETEIVVTLVTKPLPVDRTLQIACGAVVLLQAAVPADQPKILRLTFRPQGRALTLRVPDASSLSATDPRTHGILLQALTVEGAGGHSHDLLAQESSADPTPSPAGNEADYLGHIESPLPGELPDGCLEIRGWCIRKNGRPATLRLRVAGLDWRVSANLPRPDVAAIHPMLRGNACGFSVRLRLPPGEHELLIENGDAPGWDTPLMRHRFEVPRLAALRRILNPNPHNLIAFQLMAGAYHGPRPVKPEIFPRRVAANRRRPRFSIVTPSFQQGAFLRQTIRSVLDQEAAGDYFVQDGGSTDGSVELLAGRDRNDTTDGTAQKAQGGTPSSLLPSPFPLLSEPPPRLKFAGWASAPDAGQADAIVKGFAKTSGEPDDVMAWINSDDFYLPGTLAFVADYFARHPKVDVLYGNRILVDESSREIGRWFLPKHEPAVLQLNDFVPQETLFWRRRIWTAAGGLDPLLQFAMDWDLLLRFQAAGAHIVHVPYFLACFRIHPTQKTSATLHSVGRDEIEWLRHRAFGRAIPAGELLADRRMTSYLRRSAGVEMLGRIGVRIH